MGIDSMKQNKFLADTLLVRISMIKWKLQLDNILAQSIFFNNSQKNEE